MHPGGAKLLEQAAGNDATEEFYELHRKEVIERANYKKLRVGRLKDWNTQVERATEISRVPRRFSCLVYLGGCGAVPGMSTVGVASVSTSGAPPSLPPSLFRRSYPHPHAHHPRHPTYLQLGTQRFRIGWLVVGMAVVAARSTDQCGRAQGPTKTSTRKPAPTALG